MFYIEVRRGKSWRRLNTSRVFHTYEAAEAYARGLDPDGLLLGVRIKKQ